MRRVFLSVSVVIMTLLVSMSEGFAQAPGESPAVPAMSSGTMTGPTTGSPPPSLALRRDQPEDDGPMAAPRDAGHGAEYTSLTLQRLKPLDSRFIEDCPLSQV